MLALLAGMALGAECTVVAGDAAFLGADADITWFAVVGDRIAATSADPLPRGLSGEGAGLALDGAACDVLDVSGAAVTPGFVAVGTQLGLVEVGAVAATRDHDAGGTHPVRASFVVADAYNPVSSLIPIARERGITHALITPGGGRIAGQAGFVRLSGDTQADAVIDRSAAMVASLGGASKAGALRELGALLDDARLVARRGGDVQRGQTYPLAAHPRDLEALLPVVRGELPLVIGANRASDIEALIRFATAQGIRLVITGGAEAWRHADALAEADIAVVVDPTVFGPGSFDELDARPDNAALLARAGVDVMITSGSSHNARVLSQLAGIAISKGMDRDAALAAITRTPAEVFGQDTGRLAVGRDASFVVWRGLDEGAPPDPFELTTVVEAVWIAGEPQDLHTRQDALRDRYMELPGSPLPPLALP